MRQRGVAVGRKVILRVKARKPLPGRVPMVPRLRTLTPANRQEALQALKESLSPKTLESIIRSSAKTKAIAQMLGPEARKWAEDRHEIHPLPPLSKTTALILWQEHAPADTILMTRGQLGSLEPNPEEQRKLRHLLREKKLDHFELGVLIGDIGRRAKLERERGISS